MLNWQNQTTPTKSGSGNWPGRRNPRKRSCADMIRNRRPRLAARTKSRPRRPSKFALRGNPGVLGPRGIARRYCACSVRPWPESAAGRPARGIFPPAPDNSLFPPPPGSGSSGGDRFMTIFRSATIAGFRFYMPQILIFAVLIAIAASLGCPAVAGQPWVAKFQLTRAA